MKQNYEFFIQWHLTDRCNLACRHCYQKGVAHEEMTADRIVSFVSETRIMLDDWAEEYDLNIGGSFQFTGGEPLMRGDILRILTAAKKDGFATFLMTNGTMIDKDTAKRIKKTEVTAVQISLDGVPERHDAIRGPGNFDKAARGIQALANEDVEVTVNVTLTRSNMNDVKPLTKKARDLGAARIGFARLVPEGRGNRLAADMLTPADVREVYQVVRDLDVPGITAMTRDPLNCLLDSQGEHASCGGIAAAGCAAGLSGVTIMPDGMVMPCRRMNMGVGNINETPLRDIWASSHVLNSLRDKSLYTGKCGECEKWDVCRGCRAVAFAVSKAEGVPDFLADDPQCFKE